MLIFYGMPVAGSRGATMNPSDKLHIQLHLSHQDPDHNFKTELLESINASSLRFELTHGALPKLLTAAMRVLTLDRLELIRYSQELGNGNRLPDALEDVIAQTGVAVLQDIYSKYPTTLQQ